MKKTNAMRELEKAKISYSSLSYEFDENDLSAITLAAKTGQDITRIFKTLALFNEKKELVIACIPGSDEIDLKKLAKAAGSKKVEMLNMKDLMEYTGYVRGGCSPIGIKKRHRAFIHESVLKKESILISAGVRGMQIEISPADLIKYLKIEVRDLIEG
ncbi:MAG: Cys-tRNA(Pro) deacylase [Cetobacterium sp.]